MTAEFTVSSASNVEVPAGAPVLSMSLLTLNYGSEISWEIATYEPSFDEMTFTEINNGTVVCEGGRNTGTNY